MSGENLFVHSFCADITDRGENPGCQDGAGPCVVCGSWQGRPDPGWGEGAFCREGWKEGWVVCCGGPQVVWQWAIASFAKGIHKFTVSSKLINSSSRMFCGLCIGIGLRGGQRYKLSFLVLVWSYGGFKGRRVNFRSYELLETFPRNSPNRQNLVGRMEDHLGQSVCTFLQLLILRLWRNAEHGTSIYYELRNFIWLGLGRSMFLMCVCVEIRNFTILTHPSGPEWHF